MTSSFRLCTVTRSSQPCETATRLSGRSLATSSGVCGSAEASTATRCGTTAVGLLAMLRDARPAIYMWFLAKLSVVSGMQPNAVRRGRGPAVLLRGRLRLILRAVPFAQLSNPAGTSELADLLVSYDTLGICFLFWLFCPLCNASARERPVGFKTSPTQCVRERYARKKAALRRKSASGPYALHRTAQSHQRVCEN